MFTRSALTGRTFGKSDRSKIIMSSDQAGPSFTSTASGPVAGSNADNPFASDPRVSFDRVSGKWICEPLPGTDDPLLEWDTVLQKWHPVVDEDLLKSQQQAYGADADEEEDALENGSLKRRTADEQGQGPNDGKRRKTGQEKQKQGPVSSLQKELERSAASNKSATSVYVTGLPLDATIAEIAQVFERYGVLLEDEPGQPRIKLYYHEPSNASGEAQKMFKGEALVTYFKPDSVELATTVLDESCLRAHLGQSKPVMRVQRAQFGSAGSAAQAAVAASGAAKAESSSSSKQQQAEAPQPRKKLNEQDKKKIQKRNARLNEKLNDWDSDEDSPFASATTKANPSIPGANGNGETSITFATSSNPNDANSKMHAALAASNSRTVILKRMFTLQELEEDPSLLLDLKDDVRQECEDSTGGSVTNVVLYDKEEEGIMSVRFKDVDSARRCVLVSGPIMSTLSIK